MTAPLLTVRIGDRDHTLAPGAAVIIGRDPASDIRVLHPAVSRAHLVLCHLGDRWVATDNRSLNGVFLNGRRVHTVDIRGGETIRIGHPRGPALVFVLGPAPDVPATAPWEIDGCAEPPDG